MMNRYIIPCLLAFASAETAYYPFPGDVVQGGGENSGADQLLNLGKSIPFQVQLIVPSQDAVPITQEAINALVAKLWDQGGLNQNDPGPGKLRFFLLNVLVYPEKDGFVTAIQGKLFEQVELNRVHLPKDHLYQAITWEQTKLLIAPKDNFATLLDSAVEEIVKNFTTRLEAFRRLELEKN
jgi:hypothetical protein